MSINTTLIFAMILGMITSPCRQNDKLTKLAIPSQQLSDTAYAENLQKHIDSFEVLISVFNENEFVLKQHSQLKKSNDSTSKQLLKRFEAEDSVLTTRYFPSKGNSAVRGGAMLRKYKEEYYLLRSNHEAKMAALKKEAGRLDSLHDFAEKNIKSKTKEYTKAIETIKKDLSSDTVSKAFSFLFKRVRYRVYISLPSSSQIAIHNNDTKNLWALGDVLKKIRKEGSKPVMLVNAGMYLENGSPQGLLIEQKKLLATLDTNRSARDVNFYMFPNGVYFIDLNEVPQIEETNVFNKKYGPAKFKGIRLATQSGPLLVINNRLHSKFVPGSMNVNIRNGVGVSSNVNRKISYFVISDQPVNFFDFAVVFKDILGCSNALYLDGAISKMYINEDSMQSGDLTGSLGPVISVSKKTNTSKSILND